MHPSPRVRLTRGADLGWGTGVLGPQAPTPCALFRVGSLRRWHLALSCTWVNQGKRLSCFPFSDLRALLFAACRIWSLPRTPPQPLSAPCGLVLTPPPLPPARPAPRRPHPRPKPRQPTVQGEGRTQPLPLPQFLCTVIAILLHYVYMSTFAWTFVESLHVYRMLTEVFYLLASILLSLLLILKAGRRWNKYFKSRRPLFTGGLIGGLFTYVLFWTFLYGMVHVY